MKIANKDVSKRTNTTTRNISRGMVQYLGIQRTYTIMKLQEVSNLTSSRPPPKPQRTEVYILYAVKYSVTYCNCSE
jgi:hypothetical protein